MGNDETTPTETKLSSSNVIKGTVILLSLVALFTLATGNTLQGKVAFRLDMSPQDYLGVLMHLSILALIVERFVEIFASVIRNPSRVQLEGKLRMSRDKEESTVAHEALQAYKAQTGVFTLTISFVTGIIIAVAGVLVLEPLFDSSSLRGSQKEFFEAVDIVITAGLIAGGSKGVNTLTAAIGAVFDAMKYQSRVTEEKAKKDIAKPDKGD